MQLRFRLTHFLPFRGKPVTWWLEATVLCSLVPLWTEWCVPFALLAHSRTACTQVHPFHGLVSFLFEHFLRHSFPFLFGKVCSM